MNITIDTEFKSLIPPLTAEEYEGLEKSILEEGCRDALVAWEGILVDGHNRYEICEKHGIPYDVVEMVFANRDEAMLWMIDNQRSRRNLETPDRILLAQKKTAILAKKARERQVAQGGDRKSETYKNAFINIDKSDPEPRINVQKETAALAGVSTGTLAQFEYVQKRKPEMIEDIRNKDMSINQAYQAVKKEERKEVIQKQIDEIEQGVMVQPDGLFDVIAIDPPWNYGTSYDAGGRRVANPYPEMTQQELKAIELPAKDDCVLFLWTTQKFIWDAKELLDAWGFTYRSMFVWDKEKIGMGDLVRMQCEFCLIGIKGKPIFKDNHGIRDIIREPRREHSRKPDSFYQIVGDMCVGRKLEYFSREQREGWSVYGNDTEKF